MSLGEKLLDLRKKSGLSQMAGGIAENFEGVDKLISGYISSGSCSSYLRPGKLPESYNAYLEENGILDDVKDIIEAFDIQVEEASNKLADEVVLSY